MHAYIMLHVSIGHLMSSPLHEVLMAHNYGNIVGDLQLLTYTPLSSSQDVKHDSTLSVNWLLSKWGCIRQQLTTRLKLKNPFSDHIQQPAHDSNILAFEIRWSDIVGVDFKWPLTEDARLVLEAAVLSKRVFASVSGHAS